MLPCPNPLCDAEEGCCLCEHMRFVDERAHAFIKQMATDWIASGEELFLEKSVPAHLKSSS